MTTPNFQTIFNDHFVEFVSAVQDAFPDDADILAAKNALLAIRKANPKLIIKIWNKYIIAPYGKEIEKGDINFFIHKDYSNDLTNTGNSEQIMSSIDRLRKPISMMNPSEHANVVKYLQNLSKLAAMHFANNSSDL
jgi:hypothetical protein